MRYSVVLKGHGFDFKEQGEQKQLWPQRDRRVFPSFSSSVEISSRKGSLFRSSYFGELTIRLHRIP